MTDLLALFDAVQANFDDSLARGVLADWLDDRGDPRGTLVRAAEGAIAAISARDALQQRLNAHDREEVPAPELEDEADDPDGHVAERNRQRETEHYELVNARWTARCELSYAHHDACTAADERLAALSDGWFRNMRSDLVARGFDVETFCGFVDTLHARTSLLRRVRPGTAFAEPIRALYAAVGADEDDRGAPTSYVPLPYLDTLAIRYERRRFGWQSLQQRAAADLEFLLGSPWLARVRTLVLGASDRYARAELLAWAGEAVPAVRADRLSVVRVAGSDGTSLAEVRAFCSSPLVACADELDLGTLLATLDAAEIETVANLEFPGVRVLNAAFPFDERYPEDGLATLEEAGRAVRARLGSLPAHWARDGREFRWRVVPAAPVVYPGERALRAYWSATEFRPDRHDGDDSGDSGELWEPEPTDGDASVTPTRRELYRGRFRNPRR